MDFTYEAQGRAEVLKKRSSRCLCKYCGGPLRLKSIAFSEFIDARVELYCGHCDRIEYGVEPEIYQSAKYFVEELAFNCFPDLDDNQLTKQMSQAKVCEIMHWVTKNLGFIGDDGFKVPLGVDENIMGECLTFRDKDLN